MSALLDVTAPEQEQSPQSAPDKKANDVRPPKMVCPRCLSQATRRSQRFRLMDVLHGLLLRRAYRCHSCMTRFHAL